MRNRTRFILLLGLVVLFALPYRASSALPDCVQFTADLFARQEVPAISSVAKGFFFANLFPNASDSGDPTAMVWELFYPNDLNVTQAHLHLGQEGVNGGIMLFLCSNLGNGPAGTKPCGTVPDDGGITPDVSGFVVAQDIVGVTSQGMLPGDFFAFQRALRQGVAYVNVHTDKFPGGLIRAQLTPHVCEN